MDHLSRSLLNTYTAQPLDRVAHLRKDPVKLAQQYEHPQALFLVLDGHNIVMVGDQPLQLNQTQWQSLQLDHTPSLLGLRLSDSIPVFKVNVRDLMSDLVALDIDPSVLASHSLREVTLKLGMETAAIYSYALILNHWHITTRHCTRCGTLLRQGEGGSIQQCANGNCRHIEFPRINPAVIMRVTCGNKILLARQASWPEHRYSVLAGFVEIGETLESAVQREVFEEVGVTVENICYHSSQPWPFPNSLMLGYRAEAKDTTLDLEDDDIDQALWLSAEELREQMIAGTVMPPPNLSISYRLIDDWFQAETGETLETFQSNLPWHSPAEK